VARVNTRGSSGNGTAFRHFHENIQQPLIDYANHGILPIGHPWIVYALAGDRALAADLLNESCPGFEHLVDEVISTVEAVCGDISHGSPAFVMRWRDWGGLDGRPSLYP